MFTYSGFLSLVILCFSSLSVQAYEAVWQEVRSIEPSCMNEFIKESVKIDVNTADKETLQKLNGVGPKKAQDIIDFRKQHGPFKKIEDLNKIKGFGRKVLVKILEKNAGLIVAN